MMSFIALSDGLYSSFYAGIHLFVRWVRIFVSWETVAVHCTYDSGLQCSKVSDHFISQKNILCALTKIASL